MKAMDRIGFVVGVFAWTVALWYGIWTHYRSPDGIEYVGVVGLIMGGLVGFMLWGALLMFRKQIEKKFPLAPEDDPHGEISDVSGDYGFFSPYSWTPLWLALAAATCFLGLAVGWWVFMVGVVLVIPALILWVFEYWRGPHAL